MINKVRFLILSLLASAALWCSTSIGATDDMVAQDESGLNMADGATDNFGSWPGWDTYLGSFCCNAFYPYLYPPSSCESGCPGLGYGSGAWPGGWGGYGYAGGWGGLGPKK